MTKEEIHNIYLHMSGKAEGIAEVAGKADFPVLFAEAILEYNRKSWVGLTDEEIIDVIHPLVMADMPDEATDYEIAKAIEAKLKEKNT
jgi:hypothetical protein